MDKDLEEVVSLFKELDTERKTMVLKFMKFLVADQELAILSEQFNRRGQARVSLVQAFSSGGS
jgi:hypothetical protein